MNLTILLAAGQSTRFCSKIPKQLFHFNGKPIISHSIDTFSEFTDILIVTNSICLEKMQKLTKNVILNDTNARYNSLLVAWDHIKNMSFKNIIIHDAARPFIPKNYIENLLKQQGQYCLPLDNGLVKKNTDGYVIADRQNFLELCTPQMLKFESFEKLMSFGTYVEAVTLFEEYNLLAGHYKYLRKITTVEDLFTTQDFVLG